MSSKPWSWGCLALIAFISACTPPPPSQAPDEPPPRRSSGLQLVMPGNPFSAYVEAIRAQLRGTNRSLGSPLNDEQVVMAAPFERRPRLEGEACRGGVDSPYDKGVLLIHGLGATPVAMRDLADRFEAACYLVRAILLPGHGLVMEDLFEPRMDDWREAVDRAIESFAGQAERLVLVGVDLGANLALEAVTRGAASGPSMPAGVELDGLILVAPAFAYQAEYVALPTAARRDQAGYPALRYLDPDRLRYTSLPPPAIDAVNRQGARLINQAAPAQIPLLIVASADDQIAPAAPIRSWFCAQMTMPRQLLWYGRYATSAPDCRCIQRFRDSSKDQAVSCVLPHMVTGEAILDVSHVGLLAAPDNPRYGAAADFVDCLHYQRLGDRRTWQDCEGAGSAEPQKPVRYGEVSGANLRNFTLRRLTYNPDFESLADAVLSFLDHND